MYSDSLNYFVAIMLKIGANYLKFVSGNVRKQFSVKVKAKQTNKILNEKVINKLNNSNSRKAEKLFIFSTLYVNYKQ